MKSSNLKQSNEDYLQNGYTPSVPPPLKSGQEQTPFILCEVNTISIENLLATAILIGNMRQ